MRLSNKVAAVTGGAQGSGEAIGRAHADEAVSCAGKAAMISIPRSAGPHPVRQGINVKGIAPGAAGTPMGDEGAAPFAGCKTLPKGGKKRRAGLAAPAGRMGRPGDPRGVAVLLASADAVAIAARTFNVDGANGMSRE